MRFLSIKRQLFGGVRDHLFARIVDDFLERVVELYFFERDSRLRAGLRGRHLQLDCRPVGA